MLSRSKKILLILVLSTLVCISRAQEKSDPLHRLISITLDSTTIESFLEKLVEENDLYFSYNPDLLPLEIKKFSFSNRPLAEILQETLPDSLYKISLIDNQLIIHKKEPNPIKISGRIVEKDGKTPLEYAAVAVEGEYIGSMSNNDGYFDLKIPYGMRNKNLIFSSLGYKQKIVPIPQAESNPVVTLLSETIRLREIQVKPTDPLAILQQFRDKAEENYTDEPQLMVAFYRETARQDEEYVGVWEAVMEVLKAPYGVPADDRVRFLKGRKADLNRKPKEVYLKVQGGPLLINSLDIVKTQETFLNPEYQYLYKYRYEQPEMVNGRLTWIISFQRLQETEFPCFNGKIFIDSESYALVGAEFSYDKKSLKITGESFIRKEPFGFDTRPENVEYTVRYRLQDGKWHFYSAHSDVIFRVKQKKKFKTEYRNVTDILITQQYPFPKKARFGPEGILRDKDVFSEKIEVYDKAFWEDYNVIKPDEDLRKALREVNRGSE